MTENKNMVEQHGCIVCGKIHTMLVVYSASGKMIDCTVTSPGGRRVLDKLQPLASCNTHSKAEVDTSLARHYPGMEEEEDNGK
jgi:predicted naringenin-chalcone synthase